MNVIKAVSDNATTQRDELIAERVQLLHRVVEIGKDLAVLDAYELLANEQDGKTTAAPADTGAAGEAATHRPRAAVAESRG